MGKMMFNPKGSKAEKVFLKQLESRQSPPILTVVQNQKAKIEAMRNKGMESPA